MSPGSASAHRERRVHDRRHRSQVRQAARPLQIEETVVGTPERPRHLLAVMHPDDLAIERFWGHKEQADLRLRRYGGQNVGLGAKALAK